MYLVGGRLYEECSGNCKLTFIWLTGVIKFILKSLREREEKVTQIDRGQGTSEHACFITVN